MRRIALVLVACATVAATASCGVFGSDADLQIYTARHYDLEQAFDDFTDDTGITVEFIEGDDAELLEKIKQEDEDTPADVFMTVDAGNLWNAGETGLLSSIDSAELDAAVPEDLRDSGGQWYGLAMRARTVVYNPDQVDPGEFDATDTYAGLGDKKWEGRLCMRTAAASYTQSLVASLIGLHGEEKTQQIVQGWMDNDVQIMGNDIDLLETLAAGGCDVGITNHYYLARLLEKDPDFNADIYWASQEGAGTHVNISGAGVVKDGDNAADAQTLLEWLATNGQAEFTHGNHEFPVNPDVKPDELAASFGDFDRMPVNAEEYGSLNPAAVELLAEVGYE